MASSAASSWSHKLKWSAFRALEALSDLKGNEAAGQLDVEIPATPKAALWVFASTIGELNAVEPLLRTLHQRSQHLQLVLISDHAHYRDSYRSRYPGAVFCVTRGHSRDASALVRHYAPKALVIAEIPCYPAEAPCRFSSAFVFAAKNAGAQVAIINGWLYGYAPACKLDELERRLLAVDYLSAIDTICAQTEEVAQTLIDLGAPANNIHVVGNLKFDAMQQPGWTPANSKCPKLLTDLIESQRPIIVAGCMTDEDEQQRAIAAFASLKQSQPDALLVLAPRHPEVAANMQTIDAQLKAHTVAYSLRSSIADHPIPGEQACLVLDTMGELRDFYAVAAVAHVGVDHNVLEPLGFEKPVTVSPGWNSTYPSYPVYSLLHAQSVLNEAHTADELCAAWLTHLQPGKQKHDHEQARAVLATLRGATDRHLNVLNNLLQALDR